MIVTQGRYLEIESGPFLNSYKNDEGTSIDYCNTICLMDSECVYTVHFYWRMYGDYECIYYKLAAGASIADINRLSYLSNDNSASAIKQ